MLILPAMSIPSSPSLLSVCLSVRTAVCLSVCHSRFQLLPSLPSRTLSALLSDFSSTRPISRPLIFVFARLSADRTPAAALQLRRAAVHGRGALPRQRARAREMSGRSRVRVCASPSSVRLVLTRLST
jgi:hypothetical protein